VKNGKFVHVGTSSDDGPSRPRPLKTTGKPGLFTVFAQKTAHLAGKPVAFMLAAATIVVWAVTGPLFGYSDTWQLVINTGTTIITFLMVFLIQNSQNRDSLAFQVKLDELIIKLHGAGNEIAGAEDLCDEDLEALHETYRRRAQHAHDTLEKRRGPR
jgi:low affinity Fe/Cu permease